MLRSGSDVIGFSIHATDGDLGRVRDLYFDEQQWVVRHLVVDTADWLGRRQVLISPRSVVDVQWRRHRVDTVLTKEQVRSSPSWDTDKPVSRQQKVPSEEYLQLAVFWTGGDLEVRPQRDGDPYLRSLRGVTSDTVRAVDGDIGQLADVLIEDVSWTIGFIVVDLGRWRPGRHVLVPVASVAWISWLERAVHLGLSVDTVRNAPAYDPARRLSATPS